MLLSRPKTYLRAAKVARPRSKRDTGSAPDGPAPSTNRILELFGGSKPTMFRHFPTKREMFQAVVARVAARRSCEIGWQHIDIEAPEEWRRRFAGMTLRWILAEDNVFVGRMAIAEGEAFPAVAVT